MSRTNPTFDPSDQLYKAKHELGAQTKHELGAQTKMRKQL